MKMRLITYAFYRQSACLDEVSPATEDLLQIDLESGLENGDGQ